MSDAFEQQLNAARNRIAELEELVYRLELAQELRAFPDALGFFDAPAFAGPTDKRNGDTP
jgi:hypothetical protein